MGNSSSTDSKAVFYQHSARVYFTPSVLIHRGECIQISEFMVPLRKMERVFRDNRWTFVFARRGRGPWHFARILYSWNIADDGRATYRCTFIFERSSSSSSSSFINHPAVYAFPISSSQPVLLLFCVLQLNISNPKEVRFVRPSERISLNDSILLFARCRPDHLQKQQFRGGAGDVTLFARVAELVAETRGPGFHRAH